MSSLLFGGPPESTSAGARDQASPPPPSPPAHLLAQGAATPPRNSTLLVIAGVGVLLLAMGVGVLIGRSGATTKQPQGPAQVITVAGVGAAAPASTAEATFTSSWPAGKSGYTVQLQTLSSAGTSASAVEAAKSAATAKGAKAVGALESGEFPSLPSGQYVVYSGVYEKRAEAEKALSALKARFPAARVVQVSNGGASSSSSSSGSSSSSPSSSAPSTSGSGVGHTAPSAVLKSENNSKGKSYEEKSKSLPDVVETG